MATSNTNTERTPKKRRLSHLDQHYDYFSPIFQKASQPLYSDQNTAPPDFKYHPVLFNYHLMCETYHDTCWAIKHKDISAKQWSLHLTTPHNYPCIHAPHCPLQFVERKHLQKHIPICKASRLLMAPRKERIKEIHKQIINFPKQFKKPPIDKKKSLYERIVDETEPVWMTCYPDTSYVCAVHKEDATPNPLHKHPYYTDPKHHPPIPIAECWFPPIPPVKKPLPPPPPPPPPIRKTKYKIKPKRRSITPQRQHANVMNNIQTRAKRKPLQTLQSSSSDELNDSDTESSTSSSTDTDSSTRSDSEHDNHNTNRNNNRNHNNNNNNNNSNNGSTIRMTIPQTNDISPHDNNNNHNNKKTNDRNGIPQKAQSSAEDDVCAIAPNKSIPAIPLNLCLPNLNAFPVLSHAQPKGTKRKAEDVLSDTIECMPPHKKQKVNGIPTQPILAYPLIRIPTATVTNLTATPISGGEIHPISSSSSTSASNTLILSNTMSESPNGGIPRAPSVLSTSHHSKFTVPLSFCRMSTDAEDVTPPQKRNESNGKKTVINLIEDEDADGDSMMAIEIDASDIVMGDAKEDEWCNRSVGYKYRHIFHPFHIYTVSQQFTDASHDTKSKKKKRKARNIECYKMTQRTAASLSEKELSQKWDAIRKSKPRSVQSLRRKFNGSEISFEFLNFVQVVPSEHELDATHIVSSANVEHFLQSLFTKDGALEYLNVYPRSFRKTMRGLLSATPTVHDLSVKSQMFLYSFLRCGVGLLSRGFGDECTTASRHIHDAYYQFLNDHFKSISVYQDAGVRDIAFKKDGSCFKEFVFRHHPKSQDWSNCTLDLSLKMGGVMCDELENLLEQCQAIQSLKTLYNSLYPNKQLRLVNMGFFQSPATNPGQNWHTDYEFTSIYDEYTQLSPVVTVFISLVKQKCEDVRTTGSTVFCLGSNHSPTQIRKLSKKYPDECKDWLYRVVQPVLNKGDIVCFAGHTMHFGGAYNCLTTDDESGKDEDRVALYGVLHLMPKDAKHDEYLETDMNIYDGNKVESVFGGGRYSITRINNDNNNNNIKESVPVNPYEVKKHRWRDRISQV